jgi:hypothetical protein
MQNAHKPANTEQRGHEAGKAIQAVLQTFVGGLLGDNSQQDAGKNGE